MPAPLNPNNPNERMITVPGEGPITETEFRNRVATGQISSGPGGTKVQHAIDTGNYDDNYQANQDPNTRAFAETQSGGGSAQTAGGSNGQAPGTNGSAEAQAANNMKASNAGTGFGGLQPGGNPDNRTENVYALRNNDDPVSWAKRVFGQSTADFNPNSSLNPYLDQNPMANSPFSRWYQDRYGVSAPTNALVAAELSNQSPTSTYTQNQMKTMQQSGQTGPGNIGDATQNLRGVQSMLQSYAGGGANAGGNLSTTQGLFAGQLMNDPQLASQIITGQLQGATGGWGMGYLGNSLSNLATHYYNDPANRGPQSPNGSFLLQAMRQMGMA